MNPSAPGAGILYVVATPIGNLEDLTFRALRVLKEVALVAAEDTRHSRKLFQHYGITTPLTSCHAHNEAAKVESLLTRLEAGESIALISDAGTPAISDPGFVLVRQCRERGVTVTAVPGPSAVTAALSIAGLPVDRFAFEGFLPAKQGARREALQSLRSEERTLVFYEAPHRLLATLHDILLEFGNARELAVARELSKLHEEVFRGNAEAALAHFGRERVRGEIVLLVAPGEREKSEETVREALQRWRRDSDLSMKEIVKRVAREFDLPGSDVYRESLALRQDEIGGMDGG